MPAEKRKQPALTRRELEIAALVADGLTNREIATRLFISERTADGHLEHIREKLTVNTRAQVAAWYVAQAHKGDGATGVFSNLPMALTSFIGRSGDIAEVKQRLATARLLTLTGPGGVGKTRLAMAVARELMEQDSPAYSSVCFVDLARLSVTGSVEQALTTALGGRGEAGVSPIETLGSLLQNRASILVLDNCEHLVQQCADLLTRLLPLAPRLCALATSREALRVPGEDVVELAPLLEEEAVDLFTERARTAGHPIVNLTDRRLVAAICERLDRLPLAIELGAAWAPLLTGEEIVARLDRRLPLLSRGSRSEPARHQTMRAAIEWDHDLLDGSTRRLFGRLSVFAGGFSLPAAETVCADAELEPGGVLPGVAELASKSLLSPARGASGEARYRMLETVREYAAEQLSASGERDVLRTRHLEYYSGLADAAAGELHGPAQLVWLDRLEQERGNLLAALEWSEHAEPERGLSMAGALYWFWRVRGPLSEGPHWLERRLATAPDASPQVRALALEGAGRLAVHQADWSAGRERLQAALRMWRELDEPRHMARTLVALAMLSEGWLLSGDPAELREPEPIPALTEAIEIGRRAGDHVSVADALLWLAGPTARIDPQAAEQMVMQSLRLSRDAGDTWMVAVATFHMGHITSAGGDTAAALATYARAVPMFRRMRDPWGVSISLAFMARAELTEGSIGRAREAAIQSLVVPGALPHPVALETLAGVSAALADYDRALRLHGAAAEIPTSDPRLIGELDAQPWISDARKVLDVETVRRVWLEGNLMSRAEAVDLALGVHDEIGAPASRTPPANEVF